MVKTNRKRLFLEIVILCIAIGGILLAFLIPWLCNTPKDEFAAHKELYRAVAAYNFKSGPNASLEQRLNDGVSVIDVNERYFNLRARANYFAGLGYYNTAIVDLENAIEYAPSEDECISIFNQLIELAHQLHDTDREAMYQRILDKNL